MDETTKHIQEKILECASRLAHGNEPAARRRRDVLQIGYNLGRLAEVSGRGREVWDRTKAIVQDGRWENLIEWAREESWL